LATVIVVDDSLFMRSVLKDILLDLGHAVIAEAENGYDAVLKYAHFRPDLITMDINMPKMDGLEAVKKIVELDPQANILMCSALGQQEAIIKAFQAGAKDFIVKPFEMERVVNAVTKMLGS
jgi:two-component system chemotaxis response regulator CheY